MQMDYTHRDAGGHSHLFNSMRLYLSNRNRVQPIIGLSSVYEMCSDGHPPVYLCDVCLQRFSKTDIRTHIMGSLHRCNYIKSQQASEWQFGADLTHLAWPLMEMASMLEKEEGTGDVQVVRLDEVTYKEMTSCPVPDALDRLQRIKKQPSCSNVQTCAPPKFTTGVWSLQESSISVISTQQPRMNEPISRATTSATATYSDLQSAVSTQEPFQICCPTRLQMPSQDLGSPSRTLSPERAVMVSRTQKLTRSQTLSRADGSGGPTWPSQTQSLVRPHSLIKGNFGPSIVAGCTGLWSPTWTSNPPNTAYRSRAEVRDRALPLVKAGNQNELHIQDTTEIISPYTNRHKNIMLTVTVSRPPVNQDVSSTQGTKIIKYLSTFQKSVLTQDIASSQELDLAQHPTNGPEPMMTQYTSSIKEPIIKEYLTDSWEPIETQDVTCNTEPMRAQGLVVSMPCDPVVMMQELACIQEPIVNEDLPSTEDIITLDVDASEDSAPTQEPLATQRPVRSTGSCRVRSVVRRVWVSDPARQKWVKWKKSTKKKKTKKKKKKKKKKKFVVPQMLSDQFKPTEDPVMSYSGTKPLVGLQEVIKCCSVDGNPSPCCYLCQTCSQKVTKDDIIDHLTSPLHQLSYIRHHQPQLLVNMKVGMEGISQKLLTVAMQLEREEGRGQVQVVMLSACLVSELQERDYKCCMENLNFVTAERKKEPDEGLGEGGESKTIAGDSDALKQDGEPSRTILAPPSSFSSMQGNPCRGMSKRPSRVLDGTVVSPKKPRCSEPVFKVSLPMSAGPVVMERTSLAAQAHDIECDSSELTNTGENIHTLDYTPSQGFSHTDQYPVKDTDIEQYVHTGMHTEHNKDLQTELETHIQGYTHIEDGAHINVHLYGDPHMNTGMCEGCLSGRHVYQEAGLAFPNTFSDWTVRKPPAADARNGSVHTSAWSW